MKSFSVRSVMLAGHAAQAARTLQPLLLAGAASVMLAGVLSGCGPKTFSDPDAFKAYVTSTGSPYVVEKKAEGFNIQVRYAPSDAMALPAYEHYATARSAHSAREARSAREVSAQERSANTAAPSTLKRTLEDFQEARDQYDRSLYFFLTITPQGDDLIYERLKTRGFGAYSQWLQKLLFGLEEKIYLVTPNGDEVPLSIYRMERTYGMAKSRTFLLAFPDEFNGTKLREAGPVTLTVEEFGLRTGTLTFDFDAGELAQHARLKVPSSI